MDRFAGKRAHVVVATCPAVKDYCLAQGIAAVKVRVIHGCAATRPHQVSRGGNYSIASAAGKRPAGRLGRAIRRNRGGKDAIWAADLLKVIRDDAHLLVFGDGPFRQPLVRFRDQVEIANKVHFLGDCGELRRAFAAARPVLVNRPARGAAASGAGSNGGGRAGHRSQRARHVRPDRT